MQEIRKLPYNCCAMFCPNPEKPHINKWIMKVETMSSPTQKRTQLFIIKLYQIDPGKNFYIMKV